MSTYDFSTQAGTSIQVSLPVDSANTRFDSYRAEFSATRNFTTIALTKSALTSDAHNVMLALTSSDIDTLKDCRFRVIGTKAGVDTELWTGGVDYLPAAVSTAVVKPPVIRRWMHYLDTAPGRFGWTVTVTWDTPFPDANYTVGALITDPTADTQQPQIDTWTENGDGTGGTLSLIPGAPDLVVGQHLEVWGYV